jgi:serine/threonine protein kinase
MRSINRVGENRMITCPVCDAILPAENADCPRCGAGPGGGDRNLTGRAIADKYMIEAHLGSGGMCDVYRARHTTMGKQFALKVLKPALAADPRIAERFEQEARAASLIHHPHAISVVDYGHSGSRFHFIVMELVEGDTLGDLLRREGPMSVGRAAGILRQASNALDAAHSVGVVHRDIKPDNIIIAEYDGSDWVKVVDFGVAKIQEDVNRKARLTGANILVGTPRYMSPEQCEERPVDARSDIYSLGVVLYEMLSGEAPFDGDSSMRLLMAHASDPPPPLRRKRPDLSPEVEQAVMDSLEKDPSLRPQTAGDFARRFEEAAGVSRAGRAEDRSTPFSRISVPLGEPELVDDEQTLVRPRPRTPVAVASLEGDIESGRAGDMRGDDSTSITLDEPIDPQHPTPSETANVAPRPATVIYRDYSGEYRSRGGWGWAVAVIVMVLAGLASAFYFYGDRLAGRATTGGAVLEAQEAVTDARARVDSLPKDHPLRAYLPQLAQWQGELRAYSEVGEYNAEIIDRASLYRQKAEEIADQARAAAQPGRAAPAPVNSNAVAPRPEGAGDEELADDSADEEEAAEEASSNRNRNSNTSKQRRADPPVLDPVKPVPPPPPPANSNRPRPVPPATESIKLP